ncbi:pentapeptide repeat-containing protein [Pseudanabaena sp. PCC 6802]|uniref:pentapeptide repeat-containing protein n=1 Tax=Pseudanabaena sp. PCC 6802 TaxID=118173 RepID=UPI000345C91A|nr:pentapeptide repeat-containing protein [Pseudanabaena sp. PCC 6802]
MTESAPLNFADRDLSDRSFKHQYLRDANFRGANIRGCDFGGANLIGANFAYARAGLSRKQVITLVICAIGFGIAYIDALVFALIGSFSMAVAIALSTSMLAALISPFTLSLGICSLVAVFANLFSADSGWEVSTAIAIAFGCAVVLTINRTLFTVFLGAIAFSLLIALFFGFAGNLEQTLTSYRVVTVGITFSSIVTLTVMDGDRDFYAASVAGKFTIAAAAAGNCLVLSALAFAVARKCFDDDLPLEEFGYVCFAIASAIGGLVLLARAVKSINDAIGTSFQNADLTGARFDKAVMSHTDFSQARLSKVSWSRARLRKCFMRSRSRDNGSGSLDL